MTEDDLSKLRERVAEFEKIVRSARSPQNKDLPPEHAELFLRNDPVLKWSLLEFLDSYVSGRIYSAERLPAVTDRLIDTKLQLHFVTQVWPGTMNLMVFLRGFEPNDPLATPNLELARLAYSQAMIGAVRILWERLMRSIYFLEEGCDPEGKHTQRAFFRSLTSWSPRWDLLAEFQEEISEWDSSFRTPEYHKGSILKKELLGGSAVDMNEIMSPLIPVTNGVWEVLIANVAGRPHNIVRFGRRVRTSQPPKLS